METSIITTVMNGLESAAKWVIALLPMSPFRAISNSSVGEFIGNIGWILPIPEMMAILQLWITAIGIFYLYQSILRFTRAIE